MEPAAKPSDVAQSPAPTADNFLAPQRPNSGPAMAMPSPHVAVSNGEGSAHTVVDTDFVASTGVHPRTYKLAFDGPGAAAAGSLEPQNAPVSPVSNAPFNGALQPTDTVIDRGTVLEEVPLNAAEDDIRPEPQKPLSRRRALGIGLLVFGCVLAALLGLRVEANKSKVQNSSLTTPSSKLEQQQLPLTVLSKQLGIPSVASDNAVTVNGQLQVATSLILQPTAVSGPAVTGQIYYDSATNTLAYYNGTGYVHLQAGGNVTNNITNNVTNVTNVTNITNVTGGGIGGAGTPGTLALFTSASTLGDSLFSQNGSAVSIASNTIAVGTGGAMTAIQGVNGSSLSLLTANSTGVTGDITIQSGDSSTTTAGNVTIDTGNNVVAGTVIATKDFEDGIDNMGDAIFGDNSTIVQSSAQAESGTHSLAITVGSTFFPSWATGDGLSTPPFTIPVSAGHTYAFSAWVRAGTNSDNITAEAIWSNDGYGGGGEISQQTFGTVTDISTGWRRVQGVLTAPAGAVMTGLYFHASDAQTVGEVHYLDNMTVTDLSSSSASSAINIGATNAQSITIGNTAQLGATSIYGGGVNIAAGGSIVNLTGATIDATAGGASYATTSGALDITSATAATWKVAGSGATGYDLAVQAGNGGGGVGTHDKGGNLILQGGSSVDNGYGGSVIVKPQTDSPAVFQVQDSVGTSLLTADSTNNAIVLGNDGTPAVVTVRGGAASGTNVAGANLVFQGSNGTGGANGGDILLQTAAATEGGINFDSSGTGVVGHSGTSVGTVSMNIANNPGRLLIVITSNEVNSVTYAGQSLTLYDSETTGADGNVQTYIWYLVNPPAGSNTVSVDQLPGTNFDATLGAAVYYNVSQTTPFGTASVLQGKPSSSTPSGMTVNTSTTSQVVFDTITDESCSPANGQMVRVTATGPNSPNVCIGDITANGGVTPVGWQLTANDAYTEIAVPINPAVAGSTPYTIPSGSTSDIMNTRLDITAGGNVGINTSNPQATLDVNGSAFVHTDSAAAVQIQNTVGNTLFIADTHNMVVTISTLVVTGNITINGHIVTGGSAPGVAAGAAACTSPPTPTITGDDTSGTISITTGGSGCSAGGILAAVTFVNAFGAAPHVTLTPDNASTPALGYYIDGSTVSTTGFSIGTTNTPNASTTYTWNYQVLQ